MTTTFDPALMENRFQDWYSNLAKRLNLNPSPDAPGNDYDWRAAWIYGQHTGTPIPGPEGELPKYFWANPAATPKPQGGGLTDTLSNLFTTPQAWADPQPVKFAPPPKPQFSPRFNQVATPAPSPGGTLSPTPPKLGQRGQIITEDQLDPIRSVPTQELLKMLPDNDLLQIAKDSGIQVEVPGKGIVEFPAGMSKEEMERVIKDQLYGGQTITQDQLGPVQTPSPEIGDPMAESLNMFDPVAAAKELGRQIAEHGQAAGTLATAAATKLPGAIVAPITGMAVAAGGLLNRAYTGKDSPITPEEQALMDAGLPFATGDMAKDFLAGMGAEFGGRGIAWGAGKLLAPAAGKITGAGRAFIDFAKKHNLPFSPEAAVPQLWRSKLAMGLADTGVGRWWTTRQRRDLVQGASEAAGKILDDLGLPAPVAPTEAAGDLGGYLRQLANKKLTHAKFNDAMGRIPAETEMAVPNLMQALDEIGGLTTIHNIYAGKSGKAPREFNLLKRVIHRDGVISKDELDFFNKSIWRKWKDMDPEARAAAGKLKEGLLKDLDTVLDPELGQTLGAIRTAADDAYKQAETFLQGTPLAQAMRKAGTPEAKARQFFNLFSEGHKADALAIRDHLISTGHKDMWDTLKASYLEGVFKRATKLDDATGETVFRPGAFISWYDKYGKGASEIMPEHAAALRQWHNVSKGLLKDFQKYGERGKEGVIPSLKLGVLSGGGYAAGGIPGVVVSNGFALLSALGTMGRGNLGFIRNYLLKESAPFATGLVKQGAELGGVEALQRMNQGQSKTQGGHWVLDEPQPPKGGRWVLDEP